MSRFVKSGEAAPVAGTYVEAGHGGGKVKNGQRIEVEKGETLPELKTYTVTINHKGEEKKRERQHVWLLEK
ncbi:YjzC family protein [Siminovitchia sp. 179-K 8D1 HS]|uniref:YjzC family protein n=1 Tax=Siminovitchia sp. 179-K 8D1 HS TaxID=3142385 RepID=UPI00399FD5F7